MKNWIKKLWRWFVAYIKSPMKETTCDCCGRLLHIGHTHICNKNAVRNIITELRSQNKLLREKLKIQRETGDEAEKELLQAQSKVNKLIEKIQEDPDEDDNGMCNVSGRMSCKGCPQHFREKCGLTEN